jgi:protein ImuB
MRFLYLDWPHLPFCIEAARFPADSLPELVVVGGQPWEQANVLDVSPAARRLGAARGQPLGSAHRIVPEALFMTADLDAYRARVEAAIETVATFTPAVEADSDPWADGFGRLLLGIEGLHRLWGDEPTLAHRVVTAVRSALPGAPRAGIGNTRFGAQVAAVVGARRAPASGTEGVAIIDRGDAATEAAYLAPLPIRLLPANDEIRQRLLVFGLTRLGEFAALSRSAVVARFGEQGGLLHDLVRGLDGRPLRPRRPVERLRAEAELEPAVEDLEPLRFMLRALCGALCEQLAARGAGAMRATLELELERAEPFRLEQPLPEPAAAPDLLERLLFARLSTAPPRAAVNRIVLELHGAAPAAGQQLGLFAPQLARAARLDWQLATLAIRFGEQRLLRARIVDPEASLTAGRVEWRAHAAAPMSVED